MNSKPKIGDATRLTDLTVGEFRSLITDIVSTIVEQAVFELEQQLPDPDEGKELKPEVAKQLRQALHEAGELYSVEEVMKELGLDE